MHRAAQGPSQRQLRAGELIRHALVDILKREDLHDEALFDRSITVSQVVMSPDLKHAIVYVHALGASDSAGWENQELAKALHRNRKYIRGRIGREIALKFTPELIFKPDELFDQASRIEALLSETRNPEPRRP